MANKLPTRPVESTVDALENAIVALETLGWGQKAFQVKGGAVCALGALQIGTANHGLRTAASARKRLGMTGFTPIDRRTETGRLRQLYERASILLAEAARKFEARKRHMAKHKVGYVSIPMWNDDEKRTQDEVLEVFRIARKLAENAK